MCHAWRRQLEITKAGCSFSVSLDICASVKVVKGEVVLREYKDAEGGQAITAFL